MPEADSPPSEPVPAPAPEPAVLVTEAEAVAPAPPPAPMAPVALGERIEVIDVLRGLALFGIIAANMRGFAAPATAYFNTKLLWDHGADRIVQAFIDCLIQGKFITLFAFLFGVGFAVQLSRAEARGARFRGFYSRRLLGLILIGLAHELFLWWGDILVPYALGGFLLMLFRKRSDKAILIWALVLYWLPMVAALGYVIAMQFGAPAPPSKPPDMSKLQQTIQVYQQGGILQIFWKRLEELRPQYGALPFFLPRVLGIFLFGFLAWRRGVFQHAAERLPLFRRTMAWGLALGLAGNLGVTLIDQLLKVNMTRPNPLALLVWCLQSLAIPALSLGYASAVILAYHSVSWRALVTPFGAVGRTALTNYLLQSLVCTTLFYSYGFRLYGKVGPAILLLPTLVIYAAQVPASAWWLARYRFGPMEWVWRSLTYGKLPSQV
ncbi:MAG: DUF418 domain-containing protein [Acidobacteria bacterium]|nr:DUF418 domain-containing protein [Acidobacteriota bacterium]MBI3472687.1 DUF418 domain-containing protein [Candidatus Solibacter usitatus]